MKKFISIILAALLAAATLVPTAAVSGGGRYTITNPYETVNWNTWGHYKTNLHAHSSASDASEVNFYEMIEAFYERDFDVLAMTDHGVVNRGWTVKPQTVPILNVMSIPKWPKPLSEERYKEITTGSDRNGRGMTEVPLGIEQNAAVLTKNHVNSYFADYGQGIWGKENDFEGPIAAVDALGGLTHINHPGDWLESAKDINIAKDPENIKFFADILKKYPSCLGIEVLNGGDSVTRNDRVLWDGLLESVIPSGRNVWGFANSDAHSTSAIDSMFMDFLMPENNADNVRTAMENGTFFAIGRRAKNELGESFFGTGAYPTVTKISVDELNDVITIEGKDYHTVEWIAKGEIISTEKSINLREHSDEIGCYVRAQLKGDGGICMTQAFVVDDGNMTEIDDSYHPVVKYFKELWFSIKSTLIYVLFQELVRLF